MLNGGDIVFNQAEGDVVQVVVVPEDALCEGCHEPIGDEVFETDDMVVLCRKCYELCIEDEPLPAPPEGA